MSWSNLLKGVDLTLLWPTSHTPPLPYVDSNQLMRGPHPLRFHSLNTIPSSQTHASTPLRGFPHPSLIRWLPRNTTLNSHTPYSTLPPTH